MTLYARIDPLTQQVSLIELSAAEYQAFDGNPKQQWLRPLVVDAKPTPTTTQIVVDAGYVIEPTQVRQTWAAREMTSEELEAEAIRSERSQIAGYIADIQTQLDITNAQRAAMTDNQRRNALENDTRVLLRSVKLLLRYMKRAL